MMKSVAAVGCSLLLLFQRFHCQPVGEDEDLSFQPEVDFKVKSQSERASNKIKIDNEKKVENGPEISVSEHDIKTLALNHEANLGEKDFILDENITQTPEKADTNFGSVIASTLLIDDKGIDHAGGHLHTGGGCINKTSTDQHFRSGKRWITNSDRGKQLHAGGSSKDTATNQHSHDEESWSDDMLKDQDKHTGANWSNHTFGAAKKLYTLYYHLHQNNVKGTEQRLNDRESLSDDAGTGQHFLAEGSWLEDKGTNQQSHNRKSLSEENKSFQTRWDWKGNNTSDHLFHKIGDRSSNTGVDRHLHTRRGWSVDPVQHFSATEEWSTDEAKDQHLTIADLNDETGTDQQSDNRRSFSLSDETDKNLPTKGGQSDVKNREQHYLNGGDLSSDKGREQLFRSEGLLNDETDKNVLTKGSHNDIKDGEQPHPNGGDLSGDKGREQRFRNEGLLSDETDDNVITKGGQNDVKDREQHYLNGGDISGDKGRGQRSHNKDRLRNETDKNVLTKGGQNDVKDREQPYPNGGDLRDDKGREQLSRNGGHLSGEEDKDQHLQVRRGFRCTCFVSDDCCDPPRPPRPPPPPLYIPPLRRPTGEYVHPVRFAADTIRGAGRALDQTPPFAPDGRINVRNVRTLEDKCSRWFHNTLYWNCCVPYADASQQAAEQYRQRHGL